MGIYCTIQRLLRIMYSTDLLYAKYNTLRTKTIYISAWISISNLEVVQEIYYLRSRLFAFSTLQMAVWRAVSLNPLDSQRLFITAITLDGGDSKSWKVLKSLGTNHLLSFIADLYQDKQGF